MGKEVKTDCKINEVVAGLSYCFADDGAKSMFMKDPSGNLAKAKTFYSTKHPTLGLLCVRRSEQRVAHMIGASD